MDRTVIAPWKAEEKELSEKLYNKLQGLALLYPMSDEFRKLLSWDMFLKPNPAAFIQVMHYLFRLLDPVEFRKRFFWPISDKRSEANFRSSTIEYLKHLNEKHNLHWGNIKSYLVVMPGGMKFITFLLDLVGFIVQELTKQREKMLSNDFETENLKDLNVKLMAKKNLFLKEYGSEYIREIEELGIKFKDNANKVIELFGAIAKKSGIGVDQLLDDGFLNSFELSNRKLCEQKIVTPTENICLLEEPICGLKETLERYQAKEAEDTYNKASVHNALCKIREIFENEIALDEDAIIRSTTSREISINMNSLLQGFVCIKDTIQKQLTASDQIKSTNNFVTEELKSIKLEIEEIDAKITEIQKNLNAKVKERNSVKASHLSQQQKDFTSPLKYVQRRSNAENPLLRKFVSTPIIKLEMPCNARNANIRLPLQDDFNSKPFTGAYDSMLAPVPPQRSERKPKKNEQSGDLNSTMNKSKIVDPMQLLRTISKDKSKAKPIALDNTLGAKWKQRQDMFNADANETPVSPQSNTTKHSTSSFGTIALTSPFTPLTSNERTRIERVPPVECINNESNQSNSLIYSRKSAVKKVLDASLNVQNLSTSPSGRLEPLVSFEDNKLPKMQLNDETIVEESVPDVVIERQVQQDIFDEQQKNENNQNIPNVHEMEFVLDLSDCDGKDALFNTSDSVLQNVSM